MNSNELYACFTMDCEQIDELAYQGGPVTWELGERSIRGYCETLLEQGLRATLFIAPQAAERYRTTFLELAGAGTELGLHYHPQDHGYPDFFGAFTSEEQDQMLREAMDQWSQALGLTPFVFRPGNFSANDATFPTLVRLGFLAGSVSLPQRNFMEARANWVGAPFDPHLAHRANRLLPGDLPFLAEAIAPHPQLYGYVYINMHYPERSLREMEKYLGTDKFVGVKYNGEYSRAAACAPENKDVFTLLEKSYRKPLLLHTWGLPEHGNVVAYSLPAQAMELALAHPQLKIVMGHTGGTEWTSAIRAAEKAPNLYLDTCASYADLDKVGVAVRMLGADRVLFGSGATEGSPFMQKGAILDSDLTEQDRFQVLYDNARRVFDL